MSRNLVDVLGRWRWPAFGLGSLGSGWLVDNTMLPASSTSALTVVLPLLVFGVVVAGVYLRYGELSPGRCRAETNAGERCSREANLGGDCCWQHAELHGVTLVDERDRLRGAP